MNEMILLVEDEDIVRRVAARTLEKAGYRIIAMADGQSALTAMRQPDAPKLDLLLTDVVMPEMSGEELARQICAMQPNVPVLFMSGRSLDAGLMKAQFKTNIAFIQKSFTSQDLRQAVSDILRIQKSESLAGDTEPHG